MFSSQFHCPDCGSSEAYRSRPRTFVEKYILPLVLLHPARCANCFRRSHASTFARTRERSEKPAVIPRAAA